MDQQSTDATGLASSASGGLPHYLTSFLGREDELARLRSLLHDPAVRLVTITGFGGIGKTRLATSLVSSMIGDWRRIWFVSLALHHESSAATDAISQELGLGDDDLADPVIRHDLQSAPCLLVLDNLEHLIDVATHIPDLLTAWPLLTMLVTSRTPLNLAGEYVLPLGPLNSSDHTTNDAVRLFRERAQAHGATMDPSDDQAIHHLCARLEGIPLAIELAAARSTILRPAAMLDHLDMPLALLTGGPRDAPARQRTLRDTIAWSHALLSLAEQRVLHGLAVFSGGFTLEAAAAVLAEPPDSTLDVLTGLVASSLVLTATPALPGQTRFRLLDPVREFAFERLSTDGDASDRQRAHAHYFMALADDYAPRCSGPELPVINRLACAEVNNFRTAMAWSLANEEWELAARLAGGIWRYWPLPGMGEQITWRARLQEGRRWIELALLHADDLPIRSVREALLGALFFDFNLYATYDTTMIDQMLERGVAEQDPDAIFHASVNDWGHRFDIGRPLAGIDDSLAHLSALARQTGRPDNAEASVCLMMSGHLLAHQQLTEAEPIIDRAIILAQRCGNPLWQAATLQMRSELELQRGDYRTALTTIRASMTIQQELGSSFGTTSASQPAARIAIRSGHPALAIQILRAHLQDSLMTMSDNWFIQDRTLNELSVALGRTVTAETIAATPMDGTTEDLLDTLASLLETSAPPPAATTGDLSPREHDVLRLLARGESNRQIADCLFISERTVENHVRSILTRLDVPNRAAAAAWAVRHDLA